MAHVKRLILGTAGHIDHGKTALVRALTGIDCDRLPEEKERGITIDIGFAHLGLAGAQLGIVDVPGHERFVKNMLAGASGIDLVMLVIAADDSVMPQTREHLDILKLLDVRHGLIALTKADLVEAGWLDMVESDVRELVNGTFLERAPIVRTSTVTGLGIDELKQTLEHVCRQVQESQVGDLFRLAIDRSFVVHGRGTVVTGTVWSGLLRVEDEVEWLPAGKMVRVRGLQSHGRDVSEVVQGERAAINLQGIHHADVRRGHELATPGYLVPSKLLTARVSALSETPWPLKHRACVRLHVGTQERIATVALLESNALQPGESGLAQIACDEPTTAVAGQPFVIRSVSPLLTIGGGHVLQPNATRIARRDEPVLARLTQLESDEASSRAAAAIYFFGTRGWSMLDLARDTDLQLDQAEREVKKLAAARQVVETSGGAIRLHQDVAREFEETILRVLEDFHAGNPLDRLVPRPRLTQLLERRAGAGVLNTLIDRLLRSGKINGDDHAVALPRFAPKLTAAQSRLREELLRSFAAAGLTPPDVAGIARDARVSEAELRPVVDLCVSEGQLVHVGAGMFLHRDAESLLRARVREIFRGQDRLTLSRIRELLGTTRKYALPFCEYLDRVGLTRRSGDQRALVDRDVAAEPRAAREPEPARPVET